MSKLAGIGAAAAALIVSICCTGQAAALPPVEAFANLPDVRSPQLAPDGKHFAVIQSLQGRPAAVIYAINAAPTDKPVVISPGDWIIDGLRWLKSDRIAVLIKVDQEVKDELHLVHTWSHAISIGLDGKDHFMLLQGVADYHNNTNTAIILDRDQDDPNDIYMPLLQYDDKRSPAQITQDMKDPHATEKQFRLELFKINAHTGDHTKVSTGNLSTQTWYMDGHGHALARLDETEGPLRDHVLVPDGSGWRELISYDASGDKGASILGVSSDGTALVRAAIDSDGMAALDRLDLKTGEETLLSSNPQYDADGAVRDPWTERVIGTAYTADKAEIRYFDDKTEGLQKGLETAFPGNSVYAVSWDLTMDKVIVAVESPKHPIDYYFLDRTTHAAAKIGSAYPGLQESDLGAMQPYPYKARDGLEIPAYLTLPPGKPMKNLPVVVLPHGGPDARDDIGFDWMAQFFANRGYVVLQPNYRGSSGYGRKFTEAGLHQWGLKMQDDITDGVKKLVADGIADPKRACIVGASYGGYAALAGAAFSPDVYACAVSFAGVFDLPNMLGAERIRYGKDSSTLSFWISRIGSPFDDTEQLRATSPARHADQIKCPVLLLHGEGDTTVPIGQSEVMADALKRAGKPVEFIRFPGEDHYLNLADTRVRFLKETEAFLQKNIGN
jgi:dipeptidyl aminopeptidase/acylaminoacyl peptidase